MSLKIAGGPADFQQSLNAALAISPPLSLPVLLNAGLSPSLPTMIQRCHGFAASVAHNTEALVLTVLTKPPAGEDSLEWDVACAGAWAFTRRAALDWAPRRIRVNAIGLGVSPTSPWDPVEQSGRAAAPIPAPAAGIDDLVRTIHAIAGFASMTGQIIRLGG